MKKLKRSRNKQMTPQGAFCLPTTIPTITPRRTTRTTTKAKAMSLNLTARMALLRLVPKETALPRNDQQHLVVHVNLLEVAEGKAGTADIIPTVEIPPVVVAPMTYLCRLVAATAEVVVGAGAVMEEGAPVMKGEEITNGSINPKNYRRLGRMVRLRIVAGLTEGEERKDEVVRNGAGVEEKETRVEIVPRAIHRTIKTRAPPRQNQTLALKSEQTNNKVSM
jgi:hypothetical protein